MSQDTAMMDTDQRRRTGYTLEVLRKVDKRRREEKRESEIAAVKAANAAARARHKKIKETIKAQQEAAALREAAIENYAGYTIRNVSGKVQTTEKLPAQEIILQVSEETGTSVGDIKGPRRIKEIVRARQLAMGRLYVERPDLSLPQIGKAIGGFDHTTILHAVHKLGLYGARGEKIKAVKHV